MLEASDITALGYDREGEYVDDLESDYMGAGLFPEIGRLKPHHVETTAVMTTWDITDYEKR